MEILALPFLVIAILSIVAILDDILGFLQGIFKKIDP